MTFLYLNYPPQSIRLHLDDTYMYDDIAANPMRTPRQHQGHWYDEPPYESDPDDFLMAGINQYPTATIQVRIISLTTLVSNLKYPSAVSKQCNKQTICSDNTFDYPNSQHWFHCFETSANKLFLRTVRKVPPTIRNRKQYRGIYWTCLAIDFEVRHCTVLKEGGKQRILCRPFIKGKYFPCKLLSAHPLFQDSFMSVSQSVKGSSDSSVLVCATQTVVPF